MAADTHVDQRGGKAAIVAAHLPHVAHGGGAEIVGRGEDRHHRPGARIAAGALPRDEIEAGEAKQHQGSGDQRAVIGQPPASASAFIGIRDHALRPGDRHRQPFVRIPAVSSCGTGYRPGCSATTSASAAVEPWGPV